MKASDLMVGDLFKAVDYNSPFKITAIYDDVVQTQTDYQSEIDGNWYSEAEIKDLVPIELTEEILVKNGFEKFAESQTNFDYTDNDIHLEYWIGDGVFRYYTAEIHYVHQLQHLLRLCGIEKEIEL